MNFITLYSMSVYTMVFVVMVLRFTRVPRYTLISKVALISFLVVLCLVSYNGVSLPVLLYSLFDLPSVLLFIVCSLSILRLFMPIRFYISRFGFVFILILWFVLFLNSIGFFDLAFGELSYQIALVASFIALSYFFDRVLGVLMLISFVFGVYVLGTCVLCSIVDSCIALFGYFLQIGGRERYDLHRNATKFRIR